MANNNNSINKENNSKKILYTSREFASIFNDLVASIPDVSQKWTSRDESDPGIVLVKLMSMLGDMLSYNQDKMALEVYPDSVTQRKNAAQIFQLLGYKMKWYRSATCEATIINTYGQDAKMPRFCVFKTKDETISYTNVNSVELPSNTTNNGKEASVTLVQGIPVLPPRKSGKILPGANEQWHDIYSPNVDPNDIIDNRLYLSDTDIDQDNIVLIDNFDDEWIKVDNVNLQTSTGKYFELRIDEFDRPYLYLINYWKNYDVMSFKVFYIKSLGEKGQITDNMLSVVDSNIYAITGPTDNPEIYNVSGYIEIGNKASTWGYNPETPDEAREESSKYINTLDTLITLDDFYRATMRIEGVANCKATDCTNDPGFTETYPCGDINKDGKINDFDKQALQNHLNNPDDYPFDNDQVKLADINGDGKINSEDLKLLENFINGDVENSGNAGNPVNILNLLDSYIVKLYIVRKEEYEDDNIDTFKAQVLTELTPYKMMPLDINVDLESIKFYYWTVEGDIYLDEPVDLDTAQDLLLAINRQLKFDFSPEKVDFNTSIRYMDVINSIMSVSNSIEHIDMKQISYVDEENNPVDPSLLTGKATETIPVNTPDSSGQGEDLVYDFTLSNVPIKPESVLIKAEGGTIVLRDNGNGKIVGNSGILRDTGTIDYNTGEVHFELNNPFNMDLVVSYNKNVISMARYMNLNASTFNVAPESLKS